MYLASSPKQNPVYQRPNNSPVQSGEHIDPAMEDIIREVYLKDQTQGLILWNASMKIEIFREWCGVCVNLDIPTS